jgi:hypothetical protein
LTQAVGAGPRTAVDPVAGTRLTRTDHLMALTGLLLIVALLWAPFGPRVGLTFEEWKALYWTVERGGIPVLFPNRPLHYLPNTLAHLTGRPLEALNLMQAGSIFGKGALVYLLVVRMVPTAGALAFLAGVLAIVYPADTGLFTLRTVALHLAVLLSLVAIHLLLSLWRRFRWWQLAAIWVAQGLSLSMHSASSPFLLASPMLLVWQERGVSRRLLAIWAAWSVVPVAFVATNFVFVLRGNTYEANNWAQSGLGPGIRTTVHQILGRTLTAYVRHFAGGWVDALGQILPLRGDTILAIATAALVVGPVLWWHSRRGPAPRSRQEVRPYLELAALALCAMPAGFLLFLPTRWMATNWRVFFLSSLAAAIVVAVLCVLMAAAAGRWRRLALVGLGVPLVALGATAALVQHRGYAEMAQGQKRILTGIVQAAPRLQPGTALLLIDVPPYPGIRHWGPCGLITECLELSLRYVYGRMDLEALFCAFGRPPKNAVSEECRFERDELVVEYRHPWDDPPRQIVRRYPYDRLVVFETSESGAQLVANLDRYRATAAEVLYAPEVRIERAAMPPRARAMLRP